MEIQCMNPRCIHSPKKKGFKAYGQMDNLFYHKGSMVSSKGDVISEGLVLSPDQHNKYFCVGCNKEAQVV
jgi:hypothetical protein